MNFSKPSETITIQSNFAGSPIMKDEIRAAIRKMKLGNATGPDNISVEFLEALKDYEITQRNL